MIPNLLSKEPIPSNLPEELTTVIREFSDTQDTDVFLKEVFFFVVHKWGGPRYNLILKFGRLFEVDIIKIWNTSGYMHCTTMNYLIRIILIKSGKFQEVDIELVLTHTWYIAPHQYLRINMLDGTYIELDPWNYQFGIEYGCHGSGFDSMRIFPIS